MRKVLRSSWSWRALMGGACAALCACGDQPPPVSTPSDAGPPEVDAGAPPRPRVTTIERTALGAIEANNASPPTLDFELPERAVSAQLVAAAEPSTAPPPLEIQSLRSESAAYYLRDFGGGPLFVGPYDQGVVSVLLPNTPLLPFGPGTYRVSFFAPQSLSLHVTLITKRTTLPLDSGTLDVNLWFASRQLTAAGARQNAAFGQYLDQVRGYLAPAGLSLGTLSYFDVPDVATWKTLRESDVGRLARTTGGVSNDALNIFFVDRIDSDDTEQGTVLGHTAGIPGTPMRGLSTSGIALSLADWPSGSVVLANTTAHEIGHWLGLFHTTERNGRLFDPLSDTQQCEASLYDKNEDGMVTAVECARADGTNLMFWQSAARPLQQIELSQAQRFVMLRHPGVR